MNAALVSRTAVSKHIASIILVLMSVVVLKDSKEMACHVRMSMNANCPICTTAVSMHFAVTCLVLIIVLVLEGFMEMAFHVMIMMSAIAICTIAVFMHIVITL